MASSPNLDQFWQDVLSQIGAPTSQTNLAFLAAWQPFEGGWTNNDANYNPLNTTQPYGASVPINSVGVQSYATYADGVAATAQTLQNGNYPNLLSWLKSGGGNLVPQGVLPNIRTWGTGPFADAIANGKVIGFLQSGAGVSGPTITDTNGGKPISEPTGGITNTPGAGVTCTPPPVPFGLNPADWLSRKSTGNPGPTIGYYACVIGLDIQRGLWVILGLIVVGFGLWVYSQDKDAPGGTQLQKIDQIPAKAAEVGAAIGG